MPALCFAGLYAVLCLGYGRSTSYLAVLNDFWGNAFAAEHWSWGASQQWNGFFPPGYPTVLAFLPGSRLVESAFDFNIAAGVALLLVAWLFVRHACGSVAALASMALIATHPTVLTQVLTTGADAAFVTLAVGGALAFFVAVTVASRPTAIAALAGILLGISGWFRYHGFAFSAAVGVAALLIGGRKSLRPIAVAGVGVAVAAGCLAGLGLAAGDFSSVERAQAFNVYKGLVGPVNWFHLEAANLPKTLGDAVSRDPAAFRRNYFAFGAPHLWLAVPMVLAAVATRALARQFALFALTSALLFVPIVNLGASPRGVACIVPLALIAAALAGAALIDRVPPGSGRRAVAMQLFAGTALYGALTWLPEMRAFVDAARARAAVSAELESRLRADRVKVATQVFADTDFYFLDAPGWQVASYHPRTIGGWPSLDLAEYRETFPPLSTRSLDEFLEDCLRTGVTHLVLTQAASQVLRQLGQLFEGSLTSARAVEVAVLPGVRIFRIVG